MSQSGSQGAAFIRDVRQSDVIWLVRDDGGSPTFSADGTRSLPFWSTSPRARRAAAKIWGHGLRVESMPLDTWCDCVLPDAARDGLMIGVNWSGPRLVGWSFTPNEVLNLLSATHTMT
ncbi:DUF2750 domain-containing protein [Streptomyces anandii]|uniref:DUF2750 domain-containing protein n=1 Tax=Streptomyces anandii TaxID=285454 RepID=UPI003790719C